MIEHVHLTPEEEQFADKIGKQRTEENRKHGRPGFHPRGRGFSDRFGVRGEFVVAKALNESWTGFIPEEKWQRIRKVVKDVGNLYQCRGTSYTKGRLLLYPTDDPSDKFILVLCDQKPHYTIAGWLEGKDGMRPEFLDDPGDYKKECWAIPQANLKDWDVLKTEHKRIKEKKRIVKIFIPRLNETLSIGDQYSLAELNVINNAAGRLDKDSRFEYLKKIHMVKTVFEGSEILDEASQGKPRVEDLHAESKPGGVRDPAADRGSDSDAQAGLPLFDRDGLVGVLPEKERKIYDEADPGDGISYPDGDEDI